MNYVTMFLWFPKRAAAEPSGSDTRPCRESDYSENICPVRLGAS